MKASRFGLASLLALLVVGPVVLPVWAVLGAPIPTAAWEVGRIAQLAGSTAALAIGAVLIAVPAGTGLALVIERVAIPGRWLIRALAIVALFVPLPVYAVAWQVVLGAWLPPLTLEPGQVAWRPWSQGLVPAAWVHGMAGLPWVVLIVTASLRTSDRGLEEDALVLGGPALVFGRVLWPRTVLAAVAAGGWVTIQAVTEIPVTDAMMVRTFAEEVYTELVSSSSGWAGAVAVTIPVWVMAAVAGGWLARRSARAFVEPPADADRPADLPLPTARRWFIGLAVWLAVAFFIGVPAGALFWKAGGGGWTGWSSNTLISELGKVIASDGLLMLTSLGASVGVGLVTVAVAWPACRAAVASRWFGRFLFVVCVVLAVTPGPIVGRGLQLAINHLMDAEDWILERAQLRLASPPVRSALYDQPSPLPAGWAGLVRFFPVAVAVLWPAVRAIPRGLLETARLDGLGPVGTWRRVVIPLTGPAAGLALVAVTALALGEVSASKLVNPPGRSVYILRVFFEMHYGAESTVAALCLLQLGATAVVTLLGLWLFRAPRR